jgi:hypothetical protein
MKDADAAAVAAQAAATLLQAMKNNIPSNLAELARGLSAVTARMKAKDAAAVTAQAVTILVQAMKDAQAKQDSPFRSRDLSALAQGLSAVAARMEPKDAAQAATALVQASKDPLLWLPGTWATEKLAALHQLALALSAVAARMDAKDAVTTLVQVMKGANEPGPLNAAAQGLSTAAARMEAEDLARAMNDTKDPGVLNALAQGLSAVLSADPPVDLPSRSATAAAAVAFPAGTGQPLTALALLIPAVEPPPHRLSTQQLVELLKMPPFVGEARRVVLDQLGNRYHRTFADVWEFVRFAEEQKLGLDLTSPPKRPAALAAER